MILKDKDEVIECKKRTYSFILSFKNKTNLNNIIKSIITQSVSFEDNVQLILIDEGSDEFSHDIAMKYEEKYPENILFLSCPYSDEADIYNMALRYCNSKYVNFTDQLDEYDSDLLLKLENASHNIVCMREKVSDSMVDLDESPESYLTSINSVFFKRDFIEGIEFKSALTTPKLDFLTRTQIKAKKYHLISDSSYFSRKSDNLRYDYVAQINYFLKDTIDWCNSCFGHIDEFVKIITLNHLIKLIKNTAIREVLNATELDEFFKSIKYILSFLDNEDILRHVRDTSDAGFLIAVKNGDISLEGNSLKTNMDNGKPVIRTKDYVIDDLSKRKFHLDFVMLRDDRLLFSGYIKSNFSKEDLSVSAVRKYDDGNAEIISSASFNYPSRSSDYMVGIEWENVYNFDIEVPLSSGEVSSISLDLNFKKSNLNNEISFREYCNISELSNYFVKDNRIILYTQNAFHVMPYSYMKMIRYEIPGLIAVFKRKDAFFKQALFFRLVHLILYPFMRNKKIWIIMDRKNVADDNAEHFFKYAARQNDGVKKFFTVLPNTADFDRLTSEYDNVLAYESIKHRFYYIFADKLISSQGSEFYLNPFMSRAFHQTAGISNLDFYFLQHGVVLHNLSDWLVKYDRNPKMMVTSSKLECESLNSDIYNYSKDTFRVLGLPRYDNLDNSGYRKQIVIMPSWRNYISNRDDLLASEYFERFNSLINNEKLINFARKNGYDILFKPHHELSGYIDCFDDNDYVKFDMEIKYQDIFNQSAILVTDYSSVFFDFAYLKKPVIYYHYANDFHYDCEDSYFDYESMGFGDVISDEEKLVERISDYISNGAQMDDDYKKRVDEFFKYNDKNNSKRCYDAIFND